MKFPILLAFVFLTLTLSATNVDSLTAQLEKVENEDRVDLLIELTRALKKSDPLMAEAYAGEALILSERLEYKPGIAKSYLSLGTILTKNGHYVKSDSVIGKSVAIFESLNDSHGLALCYLVQGQNLYRNSQADKAIQIFDDALKVLKEDDDVESLAHLYNHYGNAYWYMNALDRSKEYYVKCLDVAEQNDLVTIQAMVLGNLALISDTLGEMVEAIKYFLKSIKLAKITSNYEHMANAQYNLGISLKNLKLYPEALDYILKAKSYYDRTDNKRSIALCTGGLATVYGKIDEVEKSLKLYKMKDSLLIELGWKDRATTHGNIGNTYRKLGMVDSSRHYLTMAQDYHTTTNDQKGIAYSYFQFGLLNMVEKDSISAQANFLESYERMSDLKYLVEKHEIASHLTGIFAAQKKFERSNHFQEVFNHLSDKIFSLSKTNEINRMLTVEKLEEFNEEIAHLQSEIEKKESQLEEGRMGDHAVWIALILSTLMLSLFVIKRFANGTSNKNGIEEQESSNPSPSLGPVITLQSENGKSEIGFGLSEVLFFEANHNYVNVHLKNEVKKIRTRLKNIEESLSAHPNIIRTHRAFLVNTDHVVDVQGNSKLLKLKLRESENEVPVSRTYQDRFKTHYSET